MSFGKKYKLYNYSLCFVGNSLLTIKKNKNCFVEGILWDIPIIDKLRLDRLGWYPQYYKLTRDVYTYISVNRALNKPDDGYYQDILYYYEQYGFDTSHIKKAHINSLYEMPL